MHIYICSFIYAWHAKTYNHKLLTYVMVKYSTYQKTLSFLPFYFFVAYLTNRMVCKIWPLASLWLSRVPSTCWTALRPARRHRLIQKKDGTDPTSASLGRTFFEADFFNRKYDFLSIKQICRLMSSINHMPIGFQSWSLCCGIEVRDLPSLHITLLYILNWI